jgi:GNAT superfamily N-acetyltransferase
MADNDKVLTAAQDDFLSEIYGFPWLKINDPLGEDNVEAVLNITKQFKAGGKIDLRIIDTPFLYSAKLQKAGWYWGNSKIVYTGKPSGQYRENLFIDDIVVTPLTGEDVSTLTENAHQIFILDRYRNDPNLDPALVKNLYQRWLSNNINGRCEEILIARGKNEAQIRGFLCLIREEKYNYFELIGIFPPYQGKGLGRLLVDEGIRRFPEKEIKVVTQFHNLAMLRVLSKAGFVPSETEVIYTIHI